MATEKAPSGARSVVSDPNYMLLYFMSRYNEDGTTDWKKVTELMGLPTVAARYVLSDSV